jgi:aminopeptidase N
MLTASGETVEIDRSGQDWDRYHCVSRDVMDSYSLTIGWFDRNTTVTTDDRLIEAYLNPKDFGKDEADILNLVREVVEFYTARYGKPEFEKIGLVQVPDSVGAGLGWPGLVWLARIMMKGQGANHREGYVAHELGHQWFPDTLKNNDVIAPWLSEGFAEYSSVTFLGHKFGIPYAAAIRETYGIYYRSVTDRGHGYALTSMMAPQPPDMRTHMIITYYKGSVVVATLESIVGKKAFEAAIAQIHEDNAGKRKYYNTMGLKKYLEDASGKDLDPYFTEWVYHTGYPIYQVGLKGEATEDTWTAHIVVDASSSDKSTPFTMPVTMVVVDEAGNRTTQVLDVNMGQNAFDVQPQTRPVRVEFDPEYRFIKQISPSLKGDIDYSGEVDCRDLAIIAAVKGAGKYSDPISAFRYDQDGDHKITDQDVDIVKKELGNAL